MNDNKALIVRYKEEINHQLSDPETLKSLLEVTFKGLQPAVAKRAMLEGYFRGFKFEDFLKKDVYAIPYGQTYSLVTSIDYSRKIGMKSGVIGKSAPSFEMKGDSIESCSITIKRKIEGDIGEFTSLVYFNEYSTGQNLWKSKPRTMIAKVAEMHALRMACPEQLSKVYTEEEFDKEKAVESTYTVKRTQHETYEGEEIADDAVITSTGDDTRGIDPAMAKELEEETNK